MAKKLYEESNIQAIADAIRTKNGTTNTYTTAEMAAAITAIEGGGGGLEEEVLTITDDCQYRFSFNGWNWFIETYGDSVQTKDIIELTNMFYQSTKLEHIPFDINISSAKTTIPLSSMFHGCEKLKNVPKINGAKPLALDYMFAYCKSLRYLPEDIEDWFDWTYLDAATSSSACSKKYIFCGCMSLRSVPMGLLKHACKSSAYNHTYFQYGFTDCYTLDELLNLPIPYTASWTSNSFSSTFNSCYRLKNITFELQEDGSPIVAPWKKQTIDLMSVGYTSLTSQVYTHNSGITADKEVTDDATYQALKNDPDWFTSLVAYSRYNHDSAVATINSLPDTSATSGGTNIIKFKGAAGSATDGGAINTLTAAEVKVANDKGWIVHVDNAVFTGI